MRWFFSGCLLAWSAAAALRAEVPFWERPPFSYSETKATDRIAGLNESWKAHPELWRNVAPLDLLRSILKELEIPESSQVLVFSKTSLQNSRISPSNPRALYHGLNAYAGYVPGGNIEVISEDPKLGLVYYVFDMADRDQGFVRKTEDCFSCHANGRTEEVPGVLVRSVFPDAEGRPLLPLGSYQIDHTSPIAERWGGYYVTGTVGSPHFGNRTYQETERPVPEDRVLAKLPPQVNAANYLRPTSDVVSLLVLEHQCRVQNLLHAAALNHQHAVWLARVLDPKADVSTGTAAALAESHAEKICSAVFYVDETDLGEGVEGDLSYQEDFRKSLPQTKDGKSLGEFRLLGRMMKLRCSHMVYSGAFATLPPELRAAVLRRMRTVLTAPAPEKKYAFLKDKERAEIDRILTETLPGYGAR